MNKTSSQEARTDAERTLAMLAGTPAQLPPKLFYDRLGSTLFTAICELAEYYPTRTEARIFKTCGPSIARLLPAGFQMIDLGAGDCRKAASLFNALSPAGYVGVDISGEFLGSAIDALRREYPHITMRALERDFTQAWSVPDELLGNPLLYFYPGSSIGNFEPNQAIDFLARLPVSRSGATSLLIGIDLVKSTEVLTAAYDDSLGVTAAFNLNALLVANKTLNTDFDISNWSHRAVFNESLSRIEMYLDAKSRCEVNWPGGSRTFEAGEAIHTESSHKYELPRFKELLAAAGFSVAGHWEDEQSWYSVVLAKSSGGASQSEPAL